MDGSRAVYFTQKEQIVTMNSYEEFKDQITARGDAVAHNKVREACLQKIADRVYS